VELSQSRFLWSENASLSEFVVIWVQFVCLHHCMYVCYMFIKYQSINQSINMIVISLAALMACWIEAYLLTWPHSFCRCCSLQLWGNLSEWQIPVWTVCQFRCVKCSCNSVKTKGDYVVSCSVALSPSSVDKLLQCVIYRQCSYQNMTA